MDQLSNALNLILGLDISALGYGLNLSKETYLKTNIGHIHCIYTVSFILLFGGAVIALFCILNRLSDARLTAKIVRLDKNDKEQLTCLRREAEQKGALTWHLFMLLVGLFSLGILFLTLATWIGRYESSQITMLLH